MYRRIFVPAIWVILTTIVGINSVDPLLTGQTRAASPCDHVQGYWEPIPHVPVKTISAALLPTGKVLMFPGHVHVLWDPTTGTFTGPIFSQTNLFCAGLAMMADGRLIAVGGHYGAGGEGGEFKGLRSAEIFDPWTHRWTRTRDMMAGRWYPTAITLADGRVMAIAGLQGSTTPNRTVEIFDPLTHTWQRLRELPKDIATTFPFTAVIPNGQVLIYGPQPPTYMLDPATGQMQFVAEMTESHGGAAQAVVDGTTGQVIVIGGTAWGNILNTVVTFLPAQRRWIQLPSMRFPRHHPNVVLLPSGQILVIGGHQTSSHQEDEEVVRVPELYLPNARMWCPQGETLYPHGYHSVALLLPDGRVLAAGPEKVAEVYYPWYFFTDSRPEIVWAPDTIAYATPFTVEFATQHPIDRIVLIRLGSVTHSINTDQRYLELPFEIVSEGEALVTAPETPAQAPPGYYLIFAVNRKDVPSTGKILWLR